MLDRRNGEETVKVNSQVFVEDQGMAYLKDIDVGYQNGTVVVVNNGVSEGENIVVVGQQSLKDSAKVKIVNNE